MKQVKIELDYKTDGPQSMKDVPLGPDDILVAEFKTGPIVRAGGAGGLINIVEHDALNWNRELCISDKPGDFTKNSVTYKKSNGNEKTVTTNWEEAMQPRIIFSDEPASGFELERNTTYYANMRTVAASNDNCGIRITLQPGD